MLFYWPTFLDSYSILLLLIPFYPSATVNRPINQSVFHPHSENRFGGYINDPPPLLFPFV